MDHQNVNTLYCNYDQNVNEPYSDYDRNVNEPYCDYNQNDHELYCEYPHFSKDVLYVEGYKRRIDKFCHRGCGRYANKECTLKECPCCEFHYCPPCWPDCLGITVCPLCATSLPEYKQIYSTECPDRTGPVRCFAMYRDPEVWFFIDSQNRLYRRLGPFKNFNENEQEAMYTMWRNSKNKYSFEKNRRNIICDLPNHRQFVFDTTTYNYHGSRFGLYQIHHGVQTMKKMHLFNNLSKYKLKPRLRKFRTLRNLGSPLREQRFYEKFDPLANRISIQRMQLFGRKGWKIGVGPKTKLHESPMSNEDLFTKGSKEWYGWPEYTEFVNDVSHLSAIIGAIDEEKLPTHYGPDLSLLCTNTTTYFRGSGMLPHQDISFPTKFIGFKRALIILVTLEVKNGVKTLSFSGDGRVSTGHMNINQEVGDITIMSPPATNQWNHLVDPLQADQATNLQIRATFR